MCHSCAVCAYSFHTYDVFVECLDVLFFSLYFYDFHCVSYTPTCVSRTQYVIRIFRVTIIIPDCLYMLFIRSLKRSARMPYVFQWANHNFIWYMPLFSYLSICGWWFTVFCIVILVRNATFICASLRRFAIYFVSFPLCVKIFHFIFWFCRLVFLLCLCCFEYLMLKFLLYSLLRNMSNMIFSSSVLGSFSLSTYALCSLRN
jgi:hypothetical protein